jgi:flagellin-specific chaperone FliS
MDDDAKAVDEVLDLLRTLRDAWSAISAASPTTSG